MVIHYITSTSFLWCTSGPTSEKFVKTWFFSIQVWIKSIKYDVLIILGHYVHYLLSLDNFIFDTVLCKFEYFLCVPCQYFMCCHIKRLSYIYHIIFSGTIWSTCWNYYILTPLRFWGFVSHFSVINWWYFSIFLEVLKSHDNSYVSLLCSFVPW